MKQGSKLLIVSSLFFGAFAAAETAKVKEPRVFSIGGADIHSLDAISRRNALVTTPFAQSYLTMDGRVGVAISYDETFTFSAMRDPEGGVVNGNPYLAGTFSSAGGSIRIDVRGLMPGPEELPNNLSRPGHALPLGAIQQNNPWAQSGQGVLAHDPRFSAVGKPFLTASLADCETTTPASMDDLTDHRGRFECYRLIHFLPRSLVGSSNTAIALFQASLTVVVDAFYYDGAAGRYKRSAAPSVVAAHYNGRFALSQSLDGNLLWALEPSATDDSRLFVSEGGRWSFNERPWDATNWSIQREIGELYALTQSNYSGLATICRIIDRASGEPSCLSPERESFGSVYKLAAHPLYLSDGAPIRTNGIPTQLNCGYTWITPEGSDFFCRPNPALKDERGSFLDYGLELMAGYESSTGMQMFAVGQHTGWMFRRLDSTINARRYNPEARNGIFLDDPLNHRVLSPIFLNTSAGFWSTDRVPSERALPFLREWPVFQFLSRNHSLDATREEFVREELLDPGTSSDMQYWEASFATGVDPACLLHLPMNEIGYDTAAYRSQNVLQSLAKTPDISNNAIFPNGRSERVFPYVGRLIGRAAFVGDTYASGADERYLSGFRGTAITFAKTGKVHVEDSDQPVCARPKGCLADEVYDQGFTAELAFLLLQPAAGLNVTLATHSNLWTLVVRDGRLQAHVSHAAATGAITETILEYENSLPSSNLEEHPGAQARKWVHVAIRVSKADASIELYVNGTQVASQPVTQNTRYQASRQESVAVSVGPGSDCSGSCIEANDVVMIDEVAFYKRPLRSQEIANQASANSDRPEFLSPEDARALLAMYFTQRNPERLSLRADGFPRHIDPKMLRIPTEFRPFLADSARFINLVDLGNALFHSPVLATNQNGEVQRLAQSNEPMTCAVCHQAAKMFTDGRSTGLGIVPLSLNVPTIINRVFGTDQFFDSRASSVLKQALMPISNSMEMNGHLPTIVARINTATEYSGLRLLFAAAFGQGDASTQRIALALSAFEIVQLSADSLADAIIAEGREAPVESNRILTQRELKKGKNLFFGKARCSACHSGPNFSDELIRDTGVASIPGAKKTPTLWGIFATAPYFHDGSAQTLHEVIDFYNAGGRPSARYNEGWRPIDPELRPLGLDATEKQALESYLLGLRNSGDYYQDHSLDLQFSSSGPIAGAVCTAISEPADPDGWSDNFLCANRDIGLRWSSSGPLAGLRCTRIVENAEPQSNTWFDNYLCLPPDSAVNLTWSMAWPVSGQRCIVFFEPRDPHAWTDNHLCYSD